MFKKSLLDTGDKHGESGDGRKELMEAAISLSSEVGVKAACEPLPGGFLP